MKRYELQVDEFILQIYPADDDSVATITEAQHKGEPLYGPYSVQDHSAHVEPGEDHIHVYLRKNQLFALNKPSGTAHDQSHGIKIPNKLAKAIRQKFPGITLPPNNLIENAPLVNRIALMLEQRGEL